MTAWQVELIKTQEADGYLGTYTKDKRFGLYSGADWDVWVHKYNLIGLLTYHEYTGNEAALNSSRKIGDLLLNTFGPGKKSILSAGTHMGMAATSVLEPMVLLYRATGDEKYLDFAKYIVQSWDEPNGPKIIKTLTETGKVNKTANGKAYEMLSNLVGLCELGSRDGRGEISGRRRKKRGPILSKISVTLPAQPAITSIFTPTTICRTTTPPTWAKPASRRRGFNSTGNCCA